jgi:PAS domain-containing protein
MKVLRSKRLENVLKDRKAAEQLRTFLASATLDQPSNIVIDTRDADGNRVRYVPRFVSIFGLGT